MACSVPVGKMEIAVLVPYSPETLLLPKSNISPSPPEGQRFAPLSPEEEARLMAYFRLLLAWKERSIHEAAA